MIPTVQHPGKYTAKHAFIATLRFFCCSKKPSLSYMLPLLFSLPSPDLCSPPLPLPTNLWQPLIFFTAFLVWSFPDCCCCYSCLWLSLLSYKWLLPLPSCFHMVSWKQTPILMLEWQLHYLLSYLPSPTVIFRQGRKGYGHWRVNLSNNKGCNLRDGPIMPQEPALWVCLVSWVYSHSVLEEGRGGQNSSLEGS